MTAAGSVDGLAHVGIAVRSLKEAIPLWTNAFGFVHVDTEPLASMHLKIAFLRAGNAEIELLEPTSPESTVARFLDRRGEGIHHLSFYVVDLEAALRRASDQGLELVDRTPRAGGHGTKIAFLHPRSLRGVLVEFCERRKS